MIRADIALPTSNFLVVGWKPWAAGENDQGP